MKDKIIITCLLIITFIISFAVVTAVIDSIDKSTGFYTQGLEDSNDVSKGWN